MRNVPDWGCFNAEALRRSGIDFLKYADSEPYIYVNRNLMKQTRHFGILPFIWLMLRGSWIISRLRQSEYSTHI